MSGQVSFPLRGVRTASIGIFPCRNCSYCSIASSIAIAATVTNDTLNALNKEGAPIKGLYVAGNTLGGRYGEAYVTPYAGNSVRMALTHGWLAGKFIATF